MILHIATDEKFIDAAYNIYESIFPNKNTFLILKKTNDTVRYLSSNNNYIFIDSDIDYIKNIENYVVKSTIIVLHSLNVYNAKIALAITDKKKVWSLFGKEFYENSYIKKKKIYGDLTFKKYLGLKYRIKELLKSQYYKFIIFKENPQLIVKEAMKKVDFLAILYEEEYEYIKESKVVNSAIGFLQFTYYPKDFTIKEIAEKVANKNKILIGNSATATNNHLEVFKIIEDKKLFTTDEVLCPLSYGDSIYKNSIIEEGQKMIGEKFKPITDFMPLEEYQSILKSCRVLIMNHYRQQAVGNVLNAMYYGAKIFLSNRSTLYHYLKRIGCCVFSVEEDLISINTQALNEDQIQINKQILDKELSMERMRNNIQHTLNPYLEI